MSTSQPIGANAVIKWGHDDPETEQVYISFGEEVYAEDEFHDCIGDTYGVADADIFFYGTAEDVDKYRKGYEDWVLVSWELVY